jgi:putative transposase
MRKRYQTRDAEASMPGLAIPEEVSAVPAEIAHSAKEGLLALAVGAGLQVLGTHPDGGVGRDAGRPQGPPRPGPGRGPPRPRAGAR